MVGRLPPPRPQTQSDRDELLIPIVSGVKELLFAPVSPFNDRPGFVAGPTPDTGLAAAVQGITRLNCRLWASRDKSAYSSRVNQYNGDVCGPYLEDLGENPTEGESLRPFDGGQCDVGYVVNWNATNENGVSFDGGPQNFPGPITAEFWGGPSPADQGTPVDNCDFFGGTFRRYQLLHAPSQQRLGLVVGCNVTLNSFSVTPLGGVPDNCGDPPADVQPPATVTPVTPIVPRFTVNIPGIGPITVNVDLGPTGNPVIEFPDFDISAEVNPDFGGDGGGGEDPSVPPPGDIGDPGGGGGAGAGGDAEGEAPPGSVLVGLKVNIVMLPPQPNEYEPGVYRGVCYVYMGVPGNLDHDPAGAMLRSGQFIFAERENLTSWRVSSNNGYELNVIPYYREVE